MESQDTGKENIQQVSILRIERFQREDIGRYECHVITTCDDDTAPVFFKAADLCYEDPVMNGGNGSTYLIQYDLYVPVLIQIWYNS